MENERKHNPQPSQSASRAGQATWARVAGLAITALTLGVFLGGLPEYYRLLQTICASASCYSSPTPETARALAAVGVSLVTAARASVALDVLTALGHAAVAVVLFWRRPDDRLAWFTALTLLTFGAFGVHGMEKINEVLAQFHPLWRVPVYTLAVLGAASVTLFDFTFPDGRFVPGWPRWPVLGLILWQALIVIFPGSWLDPLSWPALPNLLYWGGFFAACIYAQVYRYRNVSNSRQRQQTKWVVFGVSLALSGALLGVALVGLAAVDHPHPAALALLQSKIYYPFLLLVPLSIGIAILRSRLYDIDVVINRALVYSALTGLLALIYAGLVVGLQALFQAVTGPAPQLAIILSTLTIVALFQPLRRALQAFIDRRFYRRKYDAQQVLASFAGALRDEVDLDRLTESLLGVVNETVQPAHVSLRLRDGGAGAPKPR